MSSLPVQETGAWFHTTSWALVLGARADKSDLEVLLRAYWSPVYAFIRKKGFAQHDAADLTQEFLADVLVGRDLIGKADPTRGRFRAFLKTALRNYLVDHRRKLGSRKSAPNAQPRAADGAELAVAESDPADSGSNAFDRQWAATILTLTIERVEALCRQEGLDQQWSAFRINVLGPLTRKVRPMSMDALADIVGATSAEQVSNMLQTVKRRFRRTLRQVVAETVSDPEQIDDELATLRDYFQAR
ncbi:MAG: RNA polymerase sigma factor [Phycisphaerales bacterium]